MGLLDGIIRRLSKKTKYADTLTGYTPIFSQFGKDIFASDVVQQAINCIVQEMKKLNPLHIRENGLDVVPIQDDIQRILESPNPVMTKSDFIEKIMWALLLHYNSFVVPTYDTYTDKDGITRRTYTGLYPVQPSFVEFIKDNEDILYIKMRFANGYETVLPYSDVIHLKYRFSVGEYMGGNVMGEPDHDALLKTLQVNDDLLKGVSSAMKSSFQMNGIVKYNAMLDKGKTEAAIAEFNKLLNNNDSGFLPVDLKTEVVPFNKTIKLVDADTLKFIDEKILRNFGVPLCILTGDYTPAQYEAFYQKTLESFIVCLSDEFTRVLFTDRERAHGNKIRFYPKNLIFMSVDQTLEMIRLLGDSGSLYENEKRVALGLQPLPELSGVRMQSLNYVNIEYAKQYQTGGDEHDENESTAG